tara:strand:+ start:23573 stop:24550 length:978 start_codon:yes stop_codon:yes gene_type:complete
MKKVAIYGKIHSEGINILKKNKYEVIEITNDKIQKSILKENLKEVEAIAIRTATLDQEILKECSNLKIVARHGVGYDNIDLNYLNKNNIALAISSNSNSVSVSEHVMTMFLYLCKRINKSNYLVKNNKFLKRNSLPDFFEIYQKNILILGFGRIGKELSKRCLGFETNNYVYDPFIDQSIIKKNNCIPIDLISGIKIADFISIHMPFNNNTKNLITKKELSLMKKNCILVNTSRGGIINEEDLYWALKNGSIDSAGLDVFEKEPPEKENPLLKLDNLVLSPHNAALTIECRKRMAIETCNNIVNYLDKKSDLKLENIVNIKNIIL